MSIDAIGFYAFVIGFGWILTLAIGFIVYFIITAIICFISYLFNKKK